MLALIINADQPVGFRSGGRQKDDCARIIPVITRAPSINKPEAVDMYANSNLGNRVAEDPGANIELSRRYIRDQLRHGNRESSYDCKHRPQEA